MPDTTVPSGYANEDTYYATCYEQGGRKTFAIDLSLLNVAATLPRPNPERPTLGNRRVREAHARSFGKYVRQNAAWVSPALLLRASDIFGFTVDRQVAGTRFGVMSVPRLARNDLKILDGQHRILGIHYAVEEMDAELENVRSLIAAARRQGNPELEAEHRRQLEKLEQQRDRFANERISCQIHVTDDSREFQQMFVDIAENALGITSAIRARFDARKVVNRALDDVLKHALLVGRVDLEQDRIGGPSPYLMGAKHVADIIRTVAVGISGRIGRRLEDELYDADLVERANRYLDVLSAGFGILDDLIEGKVTPEDVRKRSLLGSTTMLRVFAGVFHDLSEEISDDEIQDFFGQLDRFTGAPVADESPWLSAKVFEVGASAPKARNQDMKDLTQAIVRWSRSQPDWLRAA